MNHPAHPGFRLPAILDHLRALLEGPSLASRTLDDLFCGDFATALFDGSNAAPDAFSGELAYDDEPIELLPFCWNGGDGLHYGWVVWAPDLDLDDHPCVSFAPGEDGVCWLGGNTKEALENLLVGKMQGWQKEADRF